MIFFLEIEFVLKIHQDNIQKFGGSLGIRDKNLLKSAIEMASSGFGNDFFHEFPFEMAAAYLFHISKNHAFIDGNKRTALACALTFLRMNNFTFIGSKSDLENLVLDTATGKKDKKEIAKFFEQFSQKI